MFGNSLWLIDVQNDMLWPSTKALSENFDWSIDNFYWKPNRLSVPCYRESHVSGKGVPEYEWFFWELPKKIMQNFRTGLLWHSVPFCFASLTLPRPSTVEVFDFGFAKPLIARTLCGEEWREKIKVKYIMFNRMHLKIWLIKWITTMLHRDNAKCNVFTFKARGWCQPPWLGFWRKLARNAYLPKKQFDDYTAVLLATQDSFKVVRCGFPALLGQNVQKTPLSLSV